MFVIQVERAVVSCAAPICIAARIVSALISGGAAGNLTLIDDRKLHARRELCSSDGDLFVGAIRLGRWTGEEKGEGGMEGEGWGGRREGGKKRGRGREWGERKGIGREER